MSFLPYSASGSGGWWAATTGAVVLHGAAIAIEHPAGCGGTRIAPTLIHQMLRQDAQRGVAALCGGVGQGLATVFARN